MPKPMLMAATFSSSAATATEPMFSKIRSASLATAAITTATG